MKKNLPVIITGFVALVVGLAGGYYFRGYQFTKLRGNFQKFNNNGMTPLRQARLPDGQGYAGQVGARPVQGEILSVDEKGITVKLMDGSSKIVLFSDSTTIGKSTVGIKSDLKTNSKVMVTGTQNSDGSFTASSVLLTNDGK